MTRAALILVALALVTLSIAYRPAAPAVEDGGISVYFSPDGGCANAIVDAVNSAAKTLDIAAYSMTHPEIASAVAKARRRGVKVRVLMDASQASQRYSSATYLANQKVDVRIWRGGGSMHHKSMIIDGKLLICGSFNFTKAADTQNAENLMILRDRPTLLRAFREQFETLWIKSKVYGE
jgi:phosphatidylserine/phosphatidylglycerophosphate/cardiolipin synthase-like enzyme